MSGTSSNLKPLYWTASSKKDLQAMPTEVQDTFGYALHQAQAGGKHVQAKVLKGFGSAGVLEVVEDARQHLSRCVHRRAGGGGVCAALL